MTKTENYRLNQWEPTDKLSREDFNQDNAKIDAALGVLAGAFTPNNAPWEVGILDLSNATIGNVVKTFDFAPSAVFFFASMVFSGAAVNGGYARICDLLDTSVYRQLSLEGNTLSQGFICGGPVSTLYYVALK